jgi:hypothetical protein
VVLKDPGVYSFFLTLFTVLLLARVIGQLVVVLFAPRWLPPMEQWQSGILPYPVLLASQIVVLTFMVLISADFVRGSGFFVQAHPLGGQFSVWFGGVYFAGMVARYIIRMKRHLDQRWLGGTIPIVFHSFVAAFLFTWGKYQSLITNH